MTSLPRWWPVRHVQSATSTEGSYPMTAHPGFDIEGRIALVTGSRRGIGYALAIGLAEARAVVILNGRDADALERSRNEIIDATGGVVHARAFDATSSQQVASAAKHIESEIGPVDIVVNNTGVQRPSPLLDFADEEFSPHSRHQPRQR